MIAAFFVYRHLIFVQLWLPRSVQRQRRERQSVQFILSSSKDCTLRPQQTHQQKHSYIGKKNKNLPDWFYGLW